MTQGQAVYTTSAWMMTSLLCSAVGPSVQATRKHWASKEHISEVSTAYEKLQVV
jgi:hypothetical protein